ncbi:MaoC/PaaZ C-terminal domain-containing protein [Streptomyces gobiensis]|uniref:MaoC/PaaZ C-terminal domain-containing protein n=1 Tax=Streptomyces gobiensis TaxID=2875706 RepID=UPI001E364136|nr:MaoC/PaaZ C-terminal domain-containing protein [Streptomyces gobiensis]UGY94511.1 MaoC family dehydratase [Streptomyces gobiensis]
MTTTVHGLSGLPELAGSSLGPTEWVRVDRDRVASFAHATDGQVNAHDGEGDGEEGGGGAPLGGPVADGFHTLGLIGTLFDRLLEFQEIRMNVIYGLNRVRLPSPLPVGARVRLHAEIAEVTEAGGGAMEMVVNGTVEIEDEPKPACVAQVLYRIYD